MIIGGLQKISLIDYPSKIAAVIFAQGCNFRCPYCHNPELVDPKRYGDPLDKDEVLQFLAKRKGTLEGVVITGGEPTLQADLIDFLRIIRPMGYAIKLDTNGSFPQILKEIIKEGLVDYIAMDIKAPLEKYYLVAKVKGYEEAIRESVDIIMSSGVAYEFRTTVDDDLLSQEDLAGICELISGCQKYRLQEMKETGNLLGTII